MTENIRRNSIFVRNSGDFELTEFEIAKGKDPGNEVGFSTVAYFVILSILVTSVLFYSAMQARS